MRDILRPFALPLAIAMIGVSAYIVFSLLDINGLSDTKKAVTTVENKHTIQEHTTYIYAYSIMVPEYHPKSYELGFKLEGSDVSHKVSQEMFERTRVGDKIEVEYGYKKFSGKCLLTQVRQVN